MVGESQENITCVDGESGNHTVKSQGSECFTNCLGESTLNEILLKMLSETYNEKEDLMIAGYGRWSIHN